MEEQERNDSRVFLTVAVCMLISVLFSKMSIGSLFFNLPLLLFVPRIRKKVYAVLTFVITWSVVVAIAVYDFRDVLAEGEFGILFFALYFQTMSTIGAIVWTGLRDYSDSVLRKLVLCSYPIAVIGIACAIVMSLPVSAEFIDGIKQAVASMFNTDVLGISSESFATLFVTTLLLITVPMGMMFSAIPILIAELIMYKRDEKWQYNFANMKMPNSYIWVFMGAWVLVLFTSFTTIPMGVVIVVWNLALGLSLHYFLNGLSIVVALIRRRSIYITVGRIIFPVILLCILPGVNIAVIAGLTIMGALETWIKFR